MRIREVYRAADRRLAEIDTIEKKIEIMKNKSKQRNSKRETIYIILYRPNQIERETQNHLSIKASETGDLKSTEG